MMAIRWLLVLSILLTPALALAQEPTAEQRAHARELYGQGQTAYTAGHYQEALDAYQAAFREVQNPMVLLGVALAQEHLGQREEARATLERYLILRPDAPDRASVQARIDALPAPTTGTVHVTCTPEGASIDLDGHSIGTGSAETTATPGSHELHITLAGHEPITRQIEVAAGHRVDLEIALVSQTSTTESRSDADDMVSEDDVFGSDSGETSASTEEGASEEAPTQAPPQDPSAGVWVTTAIAGVALVTGTVFGFLALSKQSDYDAMPTAGAANDGEAFALVADLSFVVAAAAGITAIVLYATETPSQATTSTASLRVMPLAGPTGGGLAVGGSF